MDQPSMATAGLTSRDCLILPIKTDGDVGLYSEDQLTLKKDLLAEGIDADYLHDSMHRKWVGRQGPVVHEIIIGLSTNAAVAAFQIWITHQFATRRLRVHAGRRIQRDGSVEEWFEAEGTGPEVAAQFEQFKDWTDG